MEKIKQTIAHLTQLNKAIQFHHNDIENKLYNETFYNLENVNSFRYDKYNADHNDNRRILFNQKRFKVYLVKCNNALKCY